MTQLGKGRAAAIIDSVKDFDPKSGQAMWKTVLEWNPISNRLTHLLMDSSWETIHKEPSTTTFDIDQLRDYR